MPRRNQNFALEVRRSFVGFFMSWLVTFEANPEICTRSLIKVALLQQQIILITILSRKSEGTPNEYLQLTFL